MTGEQDRRLFLAVFFEGPWARLSNWCYGIRKDGELRWEMPEHPKGLKWLLNDIANWADVKDRDWRGKHAARGTTPGRIWKRRP